MLSKVKVLSATGRKSTVVASAFAAAAADTSNTHTKEEEILLYIPSTFYTSIQNLQLWIGTQITTALTYVVKLSILWRLHSKLVINDLVMPFYIFPFSWLLLLLLLNRFSITRSIYKFYFNWSVCIQQFCCFRSTASNEPAAFRISLDILKFMTVTYMWNKCSFDSCTFLPFVFC